MRPIIGGDKWIAYASDGWVLVTWLTMQPSQVDGLELGL